MPAVAEARARRASFRPDIEGLRGVAVLAVVGYHAGVPGLGGGFVGVDVFYVISGFLITGLLWREIIESGTVRLARFYGNRARRLLPAAMVVLVVVAAVSALVLSPLRVPTVLGDALASAAYVGNYRFAVRGTDYLAANSPPSPMLHYWSLGVEEQFYLLWPALLVATAAAGRYVSARRPDRPRPPRPVAPVLGSLAAVAVASFALALVWTRTQPPWAFFSLPSRAWELALGGLIALAAPGWHRLPPLVSGLAGWGGLALIVIACLRLNAATPYPGTAALLPVLGTALIIAAGCAGRRAGPATVLSLPAVRLAGRYSYAWYLWHWPVLVLVPVVLGQALGLGGRLAAVAASAVLAVVTTHALEDPIRFAAVLRRSPARSLSLGAGATTVAVVTSWALLMIVPAPVGHGIAPAPPRIGLLSATGPAGTVRGSPAPTPAPNPPSPAQADQRAEQAIQALSAQVQQVVAASAGTQTVPANLNPPLRDAGTETPQPWTDGCLLHWTAITQPPCVSGDPASQTTIALVGDSHAAQWFAAFQTIAQRHWRLDTLTKVTCPLLDLPIRSPYFGGREYTECEQWRSEVLDRLRTERPALVALDMRRFYDERNYGLTAYSQPWLDSLTRTVTTLRTFGSAVLVLGPTPEPGHNVPACLSEHLNSATVCNPDRAHAINDAGITAERQATTAGGGHYADLTPLFCTAGDCPVLVATHLVFFDDDHLSTTHARWLAPVISAWVTQALTARS
jgi:peptidoglycan/LPS O-acetylase OafA/YrhL